MLRSVARWARETLSAGHGLLGVREAAAETVPAKATKRTHTKREGVGQRQLTARALK